MTKFKNQITNGFASKLEAALYQHLFLLEKAGEIFEIQTQDHVYLTDARILYIPDFKFKNKDGIEEWAEAKGYETDVWRIKRRLWSYYGPGRLTVFKGSANKLRIDEVIVPKEKKTSDV